MKSTLDTDVNNVVKKVTISIIKADFYSGIRDKK